MPPRARRADQPAILTAALRRARAAAPRGVAVLDLDSTLLDNRPRQAAILREYGRTARLDALASAGPWHLEGWDLRAAMRNTGLPGALVRLHEEGLRRHWEGRFFTSELCRHDVPVPGAAAFVRALRAAGARIAYVTGRPAAMEPGTLEVLERFGFPLPDDRTWLLMKPGEALRDDAWKAIASDAVGALGPVTLALDNEPAHVNAYALAWPRALVIHVDTDHSGRPIEVDPAIPSVADLRLDEALVFRALSGAAADATTAVP
jgi:hypothetical protein